MIRFPDAFEINFDGLPGPTHHYGGLSRGNLASMTNAESISNPREAALQSLAKMRLMLSLGLKQGVFLPHAKPTEGVLASYGFSGTEQQQLETLYQKNKEEFSALFSAADMWVANSATVTSGADALDEMIHITPANLYSHFHRRIEVAARCKQLAEIFKPPYFFVHEPLPSEMDLADEGAANHFRISLRHGRQGINGFVYGRGNQVQVFLPKTKYVPRQSMQAGASIAQNHGICNYVLFFQQNPAAINAGVFHNDVVMISNENCVIFHQEAFLEGDISGALAAHCDFPLYTLMCTEKEMPLKQAVENYFFNSQLVTYKRQNMALIMPMECKNDPNVDRIIQRIGNEFFPIRSFHYVDCSQSMRNGGGPACLRLRVPVTEQQLAGINPAYLLTNEKIDQLENCIKAHYPDRIVIEDFLDADFREQCMRAFEELQRVLIDK